MIGRALRYGLTGLITTAVSYGLFIWLIGTGWGYRVAAVLSWAASMLLGFAINRRFTFGVRGADRRALQFGLFLTGAILQLLLAMLIYELLIGDLGWAPTPAFLANLVLTISFNFAWLNAIAFGPASRNQHPRQ